MTYRGLGLPMDIDWQRHMSKGRCFICHEKGHIGKNCLKRKEQQEVRAVEVAPEQLSKDIKVEEVKD